MVDMILRFYISILSKDPSLLDKILASTSPISIAQLDLNSFHIVAPPPSDGVSLAPPFVQSISLSASGTIAASTADGRVWLGHGGEKKVLPAGSKKKRSRKWEGLKSDEGVWVKVAEGPIVSV